MSSFTQYRSDGSIAKRKDYSYDKLGRLTQVIDNTPNSKNLSIYRATIVYNAKGKMAKETFSSFSGTVGSIKTFNYDPKGMLTSYELIYNQERSTHNLRYDAKARVIRFESRTNKNHNISQRELDDKTGLLMQEIRFENGVKIGTTSYSYDQTGNVVSQRYSFQVYGGNSGREKYSYEYDTKQNWVIKRSDFYGVDNYHSQAFERREIVYY